MNTTQPPSVPAVSTSDYVSPVPRTGVVYVIVDDRKKFDQIERPVTEHALPDGRHVLSKTIGNWSMTSDDGLVIFQHWIDAPGKSTFSLGDL